MPKNGDEFCAELREAIVRSMLEPDDTMDGSNWFGRLLAYQYALNLDGKTLSEAELKNGFRDKSLTLDIRELQVDKIDPPPTDITQDVDVTGSVKMSVNRGDVKEYNFTHTLKWTLQAKSSTITPYVNPGP